MTIKLKTTMMPDKEIEVDFAEYTDLMRQGLIVDGSVKGLDKSTTQGLPPDVIEDGKAAGQGK